jgi:hypothetical protein
LHPLSKAAARLRNRLDRLHPPFQLDSRNDDLRLRERLRIGVLCHQPEDMIRVEMRDDDGLDVFCVEARGSHALREQPCFRTPGLSATSPRIDKHEPPAGSDCEHGKRYREKRIRQTAGLELCLGLLDGDTLDEVLILRLLPDAVIKREHLDVADLVLLEARAGRDLLRLRSSDEGNGLVEPKGCIGSGRAQYEVAT